MEKTSNSSSHLSFNSSSHSSSLSPATDDCVGYGHGTTTSLSVLIVTLLFLLPLYIRVLRLTHVRRSRPVATATYSDLYTVHVVVMELIVCLALVMFLIGLSVVTPSLTLLSRYMYTLGDFGKPLFHCCSCVERYLAVVHPIKYLGLKGSGARVWHVAAGCVWFLSLGLVALNYGCPSTFLSALDCSIIAISFLIVTFCCLSVLCALIRPGPGDGGGNRKKVDQTKRCAFWTITAISGALTVNLCFLVFMYIPMFWNVLDRNSTCLVYGIGMFFNLPSSAVQPLLFLHRAGKIPGCRRSEG